MIVQSSTNGMMYRCELDVTNPDAHLILFSYNGQTTNSPDQSCEFWPTNSLCEALMPPLYDFHPSAEIDGIKGAYRCPESSSEGHDVCISFLNATQTYFYIQSTLTCVSVLLLIIVPIWIERRDRSDECALGCDCFPSRGPRYKLIPQSVIDVLEDNFHPL
jgi:hypothetical protein